MKIAINQLQHTDPSLAIYEFSYKKHGRWYVYGASNNISDYTHFKEHTLRLKKYLLRNRGAKILYIGDHTKLVSTLPEYFV